MDLSSAFRNTLSNCTPTRLNDDLSRQGFAVVDNALPHEILCALSEEIQMLEDILKASPNRLATSDTDHVVLIKPHVHELSIVERSSLAVENTAILKLAKHLHSFWRNRVAITDAFRSSCESLGSLMSLDQVKVAVIQKGESVHLILPLMMRADTATA